MACLFSFPCCRSAPDEPLDPSPVLTVAPGLQHGDPFLAPDKEALGRSGETKPGPVGRKSKSEVKSKSSKESIRLETINDEQEPVLEETKKEESSKEEAVVGESSKQDTVVGESSKQEPVLQEPPKRPKSMGGQKAEVEIQKSPTMRKLETTPLSPALRKQTSFKDDVKMQISLRDDVKKQVSLKGEVKKQVSFKDEVKKKIPPLEIHSWKSLDEPKKKMFNKTLPEILAEFARLVCSSKFTVIIRDIKSTKRAEAKFELDATLQTCILTSESPVEWSVLSRFPVQSITRIIQGEQIKTEYPKLSISPEELPKIIGLHIAETILSQTPAPLFLQFCDDYHRDLFISGTKVLKQVSACSST